jgi:hypothetical protein
MTTLGLDRQRWLPLRPWRRAPETALLALLAVLGSGVVACEGSSSEQPDAPSLPELRLNQIQVVGSHNSYKQPIDASLFALFSADQPAVAASLEYGHPPLVEQLERGLRSLELDVFYDPEGGRYAQPGGIARVADAGMAAGPPYDSSVMLKPGFKVLHVQDLDFRSNCATLRLCLQQLVTWSQSRPNHLPVVVTMNAKDQVIERDDFTVPLPFDRQAVDRLDGEIVEVLGRDRLLTPDTVRGSFATLEEAVLTAGWPLLDAVRGRFLFVLDEGGDKLAAYVADRPSLEGRVMFANAPAGTSAAAFLILNDPIGQGDEIRRRVAEGYLVRTRADADTAEGRSGDTTRRDAAFASGAQVISTDYAFGSPFLDDYRVELPGGGVGRCNPVTAPAPCAVAD